MMIEDALINEAKKYYQDLKGKGATRDAFVVQKVVARLQRYLREQRAPKKKREPQEAERCEKV
jgi:hypothetical protein